ncbi:MAG: T9SS type A sorting domain-containing protein [Sediminicola sp.]
MINYYSLNRNRFSAKKSTGLNFPLLVIFLQKMLNYGPSVLNRNIKVHLATLPILLVFSISVLFAQDLIVPTHQVTFGSKLHTNRDVLNNSLKDSNNDIYLIGTTEDDFTFNDIQIIKLDSNLSEIWRKSISFNTYLSFDRVVSSYLDSKDNLILVCKSAFDAINETIIIVKLDTEGEEIWRLPLSNLENPVAYSTTEFSSFLDPDDMLSLAYTPLDSLRASNGTYFSKITEDGILLNEYSRDDFYKDGNATRPKINFIYNQGNYHYIEREYSEEFPNINFNYIKFNENSYVKKKIVISEDLNYLFDFSEDSVLQFDEFGNPVWIVIHHTYLNGFVHRGYSIIFLDQDGNLKYLEETDRSQDKYFIGSTFYNNNLIIVSNNRPKDSTNPLALTIQKYDTNGNLVLVSSNTNELGRVPFFEDSFFGLYTESNKLMRYDYDFNLQHEVQLSPINGLFYDPVSMLFINGDNYLGGINKSPMYEGSDFLSQTDWSFKKTSATSETIHFSFSGKGTSKSYSNKSIQTDIDGNYIVAISEKTGPDNFNIGGSRSPSISHILRYSPNFDLIEKSTATGPNNENYNNIWIDKPTNIIAFELNGFDYEYSYNYDSNVLILKKNDVLEWSRTWNVYEQDLPSGFIVDSNGSLFFKSTLYGAHRPALNRITIDNQFLRHELDKTPSRMIMLDNDWIFTTNDTSIRVFSNDFDLINETAIETNFDNPNSAPFIQKNNKLLIRTSFDKKLRVYNQYGELENYYIFDGDLRDRYAFFEDNDLIVMGSVSRSIVREYGWQRTTISRYKNFVLDYIGETSFGDADGDGISDFIDRCPETSANDLVNEFGCNAIVLADNNFVLKVSNETCPSAKNGRIEISAIEAHNYTAILLDNSSELAVKEFTDQVSFTNLVAGTYTICIKVEGSREFERCFELVVKALEELFVSSKIDPNSNKLTLNLSGGSTYYIELNDKKFTTTADTISLDLNKTENSLSVSTEKECQGVYKETVISDSGLFLYPNPLIHGNLFISLGDNEVGKAQVSLHEINGQLLYSETLIPLNGIIDFNMDTFGPGVYVLKLQMINSSRTYKILKR